MRDKPPRSDLFVVETLPRVAKSGSLSGWDGATIPAIGSGDDSEPALVHTTEPPSGAEQRPRYDYRRKLGEGGMGIVTLMHDAWVGRDVAVKVARGGVELERRFVREVRVQGQLEHPSIVPVYDFGRTEEERAYFVMRRVRGRTLEEVLDGLRDRDLTTLHEYGTRRLLTALERVCLAIAFAHSRGVIHRDLKPANIMLGDFGEVYVLDWGVARVGASDTSEVDEEGDATSGDLASGEKVTAHGALIGTPGYMAPEQALGEGATATAQADIYSLGAILFEVLTLEPFHRGRTAAEVIAQTLVDQERRPSRRATLDDIPPELDAICDRALAREPEQRFASVREMAEAIEQYLDGVRDGERRKLKADELARSADEALLRAQKSEGTEADAGRTQSLQLLGRALALDPLHPTARKKLFDLLLEPPEALPTAAHAELAEVDRRDRTRGSRNAAYVYASLTIFLPLFLWSGVRTFWQLLFLQISVTALFILTLWMGLTGKATPRYMRYAIVLTFLMIAGLATLFGPFVLAPAAAAGSAAAYVVGLRSNAITRRMILFLSLASILVPCLLMVTGILPSSYRVEDGKFQILPGAIYFREPAASAFLLFASIATIVSTHVLTATASVRLIEAERKLFAQSWRLRQLVTDAQPGDDSGKPVVPSLP